MKRSFLVMVLALAGTLFSSGSVEAQTKPPSLDKALRITAPLLGSKIIGNAWIRGNARPGSMVKLTISSTYFELVANQRTRKISKGAGPLNGGTHTLQVKANGQGFWQTKNFNFRNRGWSEEYKIVAKSVDGRNSTYVIVTNDVKPAVQWD